MFFQVTLPELFLVCSTRYWKKRTTESIPIKPHILKQIFTLIDQFWGLYVITTTIGREGSIRYMTTKRGGGGGEGCYGNGKATTILNESVLSLNILGNRNSICLANSS